MQFIKCSNRVKKNYYWSFSSISKHLQTQSLDALKASVGFVKWGVVWLADAFTDVSVWSSSIQWSKAW